MSATFNNKNPTYNYVLIRTAGDRVTSGVLRLGVKFIEGTLAILNTFCFQTKKGN